MINGIDVSGWNGDTFTTSGLDFVFVKATEGTSYVNPKQGRQAATARTAGLALGFYHFLHGGNIKAQAAYFVDRCASLEGDMLVCDWETPAAKGTPATNAEKDEFIREVKRLRPGHKVGLYCNTDYWKNRDRTSYAGDFLWIADPNHGAGHPAIKAAWKFHQYGQVSGTDRNVGAFQSRAALRSWAGYPTPAPAPKPPAPPAPAPKPSAYDTGQDKRIDQLAAEVKKLSQS